MTMSDHYIRLPLGDIIVHRDARQRRTIDTKGLIDSIRDRGVLNPIIVTKDGVLIAGERRLQACKELGLPDIPVRYAEDTSADELQIIELEENSKRTDLPWQDNCVAIAKLHEVYTSTDPKDEWTQMKTASRLGLKDSWISALLRLSREMENPHVAGATTATGAYNYLVRQDERRAGDVLSDVLEAGRSMFHAPSVVREGTLEAAPEPPKDLEHSILQADFLEWGPNYTGRPFNLIHCDFPYGIGVGGNIRMVPHPVREGSYADDPDDYWDLLKCLLGNIDRLMSHSAHMIFWISFVHYWTTLEAFRSLAPSLEVQTFPLMWHKSDNAGFVPAQGRTRELRRTYESALFISREERHIINYVANSYSAPTDKSNHPSAKPEPVLRHFFQAVVDDNTRLLDPTCGGASSLRAAESLGAEYVLGLEKDPEHVQNARSATRHFRALRRASNHAT